jgi:hypothetical protein
MLTSNQQSKKAVNTQNFNPQKILGVIFYEGQILLLLIATYLVDDAR